MRPGTVRPIALCVFRDGDRVLVMEGYDPSTSTTFYRPLGGTIEFGERSQQTVVREIREELDAEATDLIFLGTIESVFAFDGLTGHEIALIYEGNLADPALYQQRHLAGSEPDGTPILAVWKRMADFADGRAALYPEGLFELLAEPDEPAR